jgi:hypothetical protein
MECPIHSDEDLLGEVLRVVAGASESIANVIYATMIPLNDFIPSDRIASNAATDQQSSHLGVFQDLLPGIIYGLRLSFQPSAIRKNTHRSLGGY